MNAPTPLPFAPLPPTSGTRTPFLLERVRGGLWVAVLATALFAVADFFIAPGQLAPLYAVKLGLFAGVGLAFAILRRHQDDRTVTRVGLAALALCFAASAVAAGIGRDGLTTPLLCSAVALGTATVLPWSMLAQLGVVGLGTLAVLASTLFISQDRGALLAYPLVVVAASFGLSLVLAQALGRYRDAAARAEAQLRDEARVSAALARVGAELIASLDTGALLDRLVQLTTQVFGCELSHTVLPRDDGDFAIVAGHGDKPEDREALRVLVMPRDLLTPGLARLQREGPLQVLMDDSTDWPTAPFSRRYGITLGLYMPISRAGHIVGVHTAGFRGRVEPLSPADMRLAAGITQLASLALESARLVEALGAADRFKSDFLASMSHELRTPLNVIIGYNDMLLEDGCGPLAGEQRVAIERTQRNARELLDLVSTTLQLSRYEARGIPLELERIDVAGLLDELARDTAALPVPADVARIWDVEPGLATLLSDRLKLRMVLYNLIDNAFKCTARGHVAVRAQATRGGVEFAVEDTGIGIPPAAMTQIFEPFRQLGEGAGAERGAGLGLHLVRRLVAALGGEVGVESNVGRGTTFRVWMPWQPAVAVPAAQRPLSA